MASKSSFAGETFLFDVLQSLLDWLHDNCHKYELLKDLTDALSAVRDLLDDAVTKEYTKPEVMQWLFNLQNTVYKVEDLVDEMVADDAVTELRLTTYPEGSKPLSNDKRFRSEIKTDVERLQVLEKEAAKLGLLKLTEGEAFEIFRSATSSADESIVYGRDKDKDAIVEFLLSDDAGVGASVLSIIGMAGIGKTTLAQLAFNDQKLKNHFDIRLWACVGHDLEILKVTKGIYLALSDDISYSNGNKLLLVLDDVCEVNYSDLYYFRLILGATLKGSKIIVTTRSKAVAAQVSAMSVYEPPLLCEEDCWSVFAKHAFKNTSPSSDPDFVAVAKEISKKCHGLPLAAKGLGSVLCSKPSAEEWKAVLTNRLWDIGTGTSNELLVLNVWYSLLPANLKRCIAYCSVFPQNYEFEKAELVRLWMAEGFLHQPKGRREEDAGEDCFAYLLWVSFFRPSSRNKSCFVMHPIFYELALQKSERSSYRLTDRDDGPYKIPETVLHLSLVHTKDDASQALRGLSCTKRLMTFLAFSSRYSSHKYRYDDVLEELLVKQPRLRVLSVPFYNIRKMPKAIGRLKQLRYLDLSNTHLAELPSSILASLNNLQTLDLSYCFCLRKLPEDMWKLNNLRHLLITESGVKEMPLRLSTLSNLQTLSDFIQGYGGSGINELSGLSNLRGALTITILLNLDPHKDCLDGCLKEMIYLDKLTIKWRNGRGDPVKDEQVLENLVPPEELKELVIESYSGRKFPNWLGEFTVYNIVKLCLTDGTECSLFPSLGQLPSLEVLIIEEFSEVESLQQEFYGRNPLSNKPFQALKILKFKMMEKWQKWETPDAYGDFPCLEELYIEDCPLLGGDMPKRLPSLAKLVISRCPKLVDSLLLPVLPAQCGVWIDRKRVSSRGEDEAIYWVRIAEETAKSYDSEKGGLTHNITETKSLVGDLYNIMKKATNYHEKRERKKSMFRFKLFSQMEKKLGRRVADKMERAYYTSIDVRNALSASTGTFCPMIIPKLERTDIRPLRILKPINLANIRKLNSIDNLRTLVSLEQALKKSPYKIEHFWLENQVSVHLSNINCFDLPSLGQMPSLKFLEIKGLNGVRRLGLNFHGKISSSNKPFRSLEILKFNKMLRWEEWETVQIKGVGFLRLQELQVTNCPNLKGTIPRCLPSLVRLTISGCLKLVDPLLLPINGVEGASQSSSLSTETFPQQETASPSPNQAHDQADEVVSSPGRSEPIAVTQLGILPGTNDIPRPPQEDDQTELDTSTDDDDDWRQYSSPRILNVSDIAELNDIAEGKMPTDTNTLRIEGCDALKSLSPEILCSPHLLHLYVIDCGSFRSFPVRADSTRLKTLQIRNCRKVKFSPGRMPELDHLCIGSSCDSLDCLVLDSFPKLRILCLWDCKTLKSLNLKGENKLESLESLEIRDCPDLKSFLPEGFLGDKLTSIFILNCKNLQYLPSQVCHLKSLKTLFICQCPELESLPTDGLPASLSLLCITLCDKLTLKKEWKLYELKALTLLEIEGGCEDIVSFPVEGLLPASLVSLRISRLQNLKYLNKDALERLTSLEKLEINSCEKLHSLPDGLPSSLSFLYISKCPLLKAKLKNKHGIDWSRIVDIPSIYIDDEEWH